MTDELRLQVGGTLGFGDLYIERTEDQKAYEVLAAREFLNILTSRQMGKSSLMVRLVKRLREGRGARIASVDMAGDLGTPEDADRWYTGFLDQIALDLDLDIDVEHWWKNEGTGTANARLLQFFEEVVRATPEAPVYIFVDEIDASLKLPYSDDLFTAIRSIYNQRATTAEFRALTFCLIGVAAPNEFIKERRTTPYNIGTTIELRDFDPDRDDLTPLYEAMTADDVSGKKLVRAVLERTAGHPFLTLALCANARRLNARSKREVSKSIDSILGENRHDAVATHLASIDTFMATRLADQLKTLRLYHHILNGRTMPDRREVPYLELRLSGLVKRSAEGNIVMRNSFYGTRFGYGWLARTQPMTGQRRLRRIVVISSSVAAIAIAVATYFVVFRSSVTVVAQADIDDLTATGSPDLAVAKLDNVCAVLRNGATLSSQQLDLVNRHVADLWDKDARELEEKANAPNLSLEEKLTYRAAAAVRRGEISKTLESDAEAANIAYLERTIPGASMSAIGTVRWLSPTQLVSVSKDGWLRLLDTTKPEAVKQVQVQGLSWSALDVCSDGSCVLTVQNPGTARMYDGNLKEIGSFALPTVSDDRVLTVAVEHGTNKTIAFGSQAGRVAVGSFAEGGVFVPAMQMDRIAQTARGEVVPQPVNAVQFSSDGKALLVAEEHTLELFDIATKAPRVHSSVPHEVYDARLSSTGTWFGVAAEGTAIVYHLGAKGLSQGISSVEDKVFHSIAFSHADEYAMTSATVLDKNLGFLSVIALPSGSDVLKLATAAPIHDAEPSPGAGTPKIATAGDDGTVRIWHLTKDPPAATLAELWKAWQVKLGKTLDGKGSAVALESEPSAAPFRHSCVVRQDDGR